MLRGYRGALRELARTGGFAAFALHVRVGIAHLARRALGGRREDPIQRFFANYRDDGVTVPQALSRELRLESEPCLVCGLCSSECARVGGQPALDPRDAVVAAARLGVDAIRLGIAADLGGSCAGCDACEAVCPAGIPIQRIQQSLAEAGRMG